MDSFARTIFGLTIIPLLIILIEANLGVNENIIVQGTKDKTEEKYECPGKCVPMLSGCWRSTKTYNFVGYLKATGVSSVLARNIAHNKKGSIYFSFKDEKSRIVTVIARGWTVLGAKVQMNYTNVNADNETMYDTPVNALTINSPIPIKTIFATNEKRITLYVVTESDRNNRIFSVEWTIPDKSSNNNMIEKWVHIPTQTEAISLFDKAHTPDLDPYCSDILRYKYKLI